VADVASIALAEYGEGVLNGEVVQAAEYEEARMFLEQAQRLVHGLGSDARVVAAGSLARMAEGVQRLRPEPELRAVLEQLRQDLAAAVGAALDPLPRAAPSLERGEVLYERYCTQCHGDAGAGDGVAAAALDPPAADLTDRDALRDTSPLDFFRKINVGVAGTAMPGFADRIGSDDRWAIALYVSSLRYPAVLRRDGGGMLSRLCGECRLVVSDFDATAVLSDDSLAALLAGWVNGDVDAPSRDRLTAYARVAGARELLGGDRVLRTRRVAARAADGAGRAVAAGRSGDREAAQREALDAYLAFEEIESAVRARDPAAAAAVEAAFRTLRAAGATGDDTQLAAAERRVRETLGSAVDAVRADTGPGVVFAQSLVILLREGFEAILIVGALVTFLVKAGAEERKRDIGYGVLAALGASLLTAVTFATLFRNAVRHQEVLEGVTMLTAAAVLFWVSYWLVSKIELRKWRQFVESQMRRALGSGRVWALGLVAFLAVYREGFETVLFYAAMFAATDGAAGQIGAIVVGMAVGAVALVIVYLAIERYGLRIPLKPFFAVTSGLLYLMAFSFAGQGVAELQEAGAISATPLEWLPAVPVLGVFPTYQTFFIQLAVALALAAALAWVFWLEPRLVPVLKRRH
jgi:high-affinity iron transporter